jgi:hypothetical protein
MRERNLKNFIKAIDEKIFFNLLRFIYFYFLNFKKNLFLNNRKKYFFNTSYLNYNNNIFTKICEKYMTDKGSISHNKKFTWYGGPHSYSNYYFSIFNHFKDDVKLVFECGIGSLPGKSGASLRAWREYFKNAQIYGADINKNILFEEDRIKTFYVDQLNTPSIEAMWKKIEIKNFDIIIDDGLHTTDANINLFINSFNKLKENGIYIIEDVCSKEFNNIMEKLKNFNPELIVLGRNNLSYHGDNNLIIIRNI